MRTKDAFPILSALLFSILIFSVFGFSSNQNGKSMHTYSEKDSPQGFPPARSISDSLAYAFFQNYHRSDTSAGSQGLLRNRGRAIVQFYVDEASLIEPLKQKARALGKEFIGLSAIPAYDDQNHTNTLIWVAVIDADAGSGVEPALMLPKQNEYWHDYIYDYTVSCPTSCSIQSEQLWNANWKP